jgi:hypothetical protein
MGGGLSPEQQRLLEIIMSPDQAGPAPPPDDETVGTKLGAQIFSTLGDALSGYAAGINGTQQSQFHNTYLARREYKRSERERHGAQQAQSQAEAKRRGAEYLFRANEQNADRQAAGEDRAAGEQKAAAIRAEDQRIRAEEREQTRSDMLIREAADETYRQGQAKWQQRVDQSLIDSRNRDKNPDRNVKGIADAASVALVLRNGAPATKDEPEVPSAQAKLAAGATPQSLLDEFEEELDTMALSGKDREEAIQYFLKKINPIIEQHDKTKQAEAAAQAEATRQPTSVTGSPGALIRGINLLRGGGQ